MMRFLYIGRHASVEIACGGMRFEQLPGGRTRARTGVGAPGTERLRAATGTIIEVDDTDTLALARVRVAQDLAGLMFRQLP